MLVENETLSESARMKMRKRDESKRSNRPGEPITTPLGSESFPRERFSQGEQNHKKTREQRWRTWKRKIEKERQRVSENFKEKHDSEKERKRERQGQEQIKHWYSLRTNWIRLDSSHIRL